MVDSKYSDRAGSGWTPRDVGRLSTSGQRRDSAPVSRLIAIIDEYKDRTGQPSDASISRAIGVARQTVSSWRRRGIKDLPDRNTLVELARLTSRDYETVVLRAALLDAGWVAEEPTTRSGESRGTGTD